MQEIVFDGNSSNIQKLIGGKNVWNAELEVVGREGGRPWRIMGFFGAVQSEDSVSAAEL